MLLVFPTGCTPHEPTPPSNTDTAARGLDTAIAGAMVSAAVPGAIIGIWGPEIEYVRALGVADKSTGAPMRPDFYTRIGSETKTFTVTAALQLADSGRLRLDDPVADYVAAVPDGDRITLRQLAGMNSCLPNYTDSRAFQRAYLADPHRSFTPRQLLDYAFAEPAPCAPGTGFHYSNTNAVLLGLVVENVSGQPLPDYIRDHITGPLRLNHTSFPTTAEFPQPHAQGYTNWTPDGAEAVATDWNPSWSWAAGAMISTLDDLHAWTIALATGALLSDAMGHQRLETAKVPGVASDIGYGLGMVDLAGWIGHTGTVPGYGTVAVYLPEKRLTLVILVNTDMRFRGRDAAMTLAAAITRVVSPEHVFDVGL